MKTIVRGIILFLGFIVLCFIFYLYKLHALAVEDNKIFEYRCLHVNPILIGYKNAFLKYADFLNTYPNTSYSPKDVEGFINAYESGLQAYVPEEEKWLMMDKQLMRRWDFQLIEPWYIKQGAQYQWNMYNAYRADAASMVALLDHPETAKNVSPDAPNPIRDNLDTAITQYNDFFDHASQINDWRKWFGSVPIPKGCTPDNTTIPSTNDAIQWNKEAPATPSGIPIDPNFSS